MNPELGDDEEGEPAGALRRIGIGSGQQRQHVGSAGKGAPRLGAVDHPPVFAIDRGFVYWQFQQGGTRKVNKGADIKAEGQTLAIGENEGGTKLI